MRHGITRRQAQLLGFIAAHTAEHGCPPTFAEMATEMGIASKGAIAEFIRHLEERGHITRLPNKRQSISVMDSEVVRGAVRFRSLSRATSIPQVTRREDEVVPVRDTSATTSHPRGLTQ